MIPIPHQFPQRIPEILPLPVYCVPMNAVQNASTASVMHLFHPCKSMWYMCIAQVISPLSHHFANVL